MMYLVWGSVILCVLWCFVPTFDEAEIKVLNRKVIWKDKHKHVYYKRTRPTDKV